MSAEIYEPKALTALETLGLQVARERLDAAAQRAVAENWSYRHFLGYLLDGELAERHARTVALNLQFARFPVLKRLADFDFAAQPSLDPKLFDELAAGRYLAEGRNVILLGPPGVGKTHLAIGLGAACAEMGHRAYFVSAVELARKLALALAQNRLHREMNNFTRPKLLIIDEVGYLTLDQTQASLLETHPQRPRSGARFRALWSAASCAIPRAPAAAGGVGAHRTVATSGAKGGSRARDQRQGVRDAGAGARRAAGCSMAFEINLSRNQPDYFPEEPPPRTSPQP